MDPSQPDDPVSGPATSDTLPSLRFADFLQDIVARFDAQFRHIYVNHAAQAATGLPAQGFLGRTNRELGMPEDLVARWDGALAEVFRTGKPMDLEFNYTGRVGERRMRSHLAPEHDARGRVVSVVSVARDVTAEAGLTALLDNETQAEHFRAIVDSSDDAIISKTLDGIVTSWNPGAQDIFGYSAAEMVGQPMLLLFPADRLDEERFILERLIAGEKVDHFETVRVCKDGSTVNVSVTISPIRDHSGKVVGASKIARDISRRLQADNRLRLTASVFSHTGEGIVITDRAGRILEVNEAFTRITGYERPDVQGRTAAMFRSGRQGPQVLGDLWRGLGEQGHCQGEVWSRRKDGSAFAGHVTVNAVRGGDGELLNYVALFADVTSLRVHQEQLEHVAHYDALTDLPNRLLLSDRLHQAMAQAKRHQQVLAVLYLDLDGFKSVNDRYGHAVGDELLVAVAQAIRAELREVDTLARIGGDEFVAVLVDVRGAADCDHLVGRILAACARTVEVREHTLRISASIGVTLYPQDDADADQLMRHADRAMYEAKQAGRNRYQLFDAAQDAEFKSRSQQLLEFAGALLQEFVLHYQPKVNLRTGAVVGVEALVRWQHPELGLLVPPQFLPLIEKHPLSEALGTWVIATALEQMTLWQAAGLNMPVSINISARQLQQVDFVPRLAAQLAACPNVNPADIELEILETSALEDMGAVSAVMRDCHALGVRFAIDDFGTGYSSLTYLRGLPAATIKIDQSFVRGMLSDHEDLAIVRGVIGLAVAFRRTVIAEGVETMAHCRKLLELGCELAQGYGIARPMRGDQLVAWVAGHSRRSLPP